MTLCSYLCCSYSSWVAFLCKMILCFFSFLQYHFDNFDRIFIYFAGVWNFYIHILKHLICKNGKFIFIFIDLVGKILCHLTYYFIFECQCTKSVIHNYVKWNENKRYYYFRKLYWSTVKKKIRYNMKIFISVELSGLLLWRSIS